MAQRSKVTVEDALQKSFEELHVPHRTLKLKQRDAALAILRGKNVFVRLPTGYGKTIVTGVLPRAFDHLHERTGPQMKAIVLIVCPLISLMMDQRRRLREMGLTADFLGTAQTDQSAIEAVVSGRVQCVFASPETLLGNPQTRAMLMSKVYEENLAAVVVDEAHCVSKWLAKWK